MSILRIHQMLLDSPEAVDRRFDLIPSEGVSIRVDSRYLQKQYVAIEFLEQLVETEALGHIDGKMIRIISEQILLRLPNMVV